MTYPPPPVPSDRPCGAYGEYPLGSRASRFRMFPILAFSPKGQDKNRPGLTTRFSVLLANAPPFIPLSLLVQTASRWSPFLRSSPLALSSLAPSLHPLSSPSLVVVRCRSESPSRLRGPTYPNVSAYIRSYQVRYLNIISFAVTVATPSNSPAYNRDYFKHWIISKISSPPKLIRAS